LDRIYMIFRMGILSNPVNPVKTSSDKTILTVQRKPQVHYAANL
jgi:hypothetical protein